MTAPMSGVSPPTPPASPPATLRREIASAYFASGTRLGSSLVVSALVYRFLGPEAFAMLALVRGTIGLLSYLSLGLAPALVHRAARVGIQTTGQLSLFRQLYSNALAIALLTGLTGVAVSVIYAMAFERLYRVPFQLEGAMWRVVLPFGIGTILRLISDAPGGVLQVRGRIVYDNRLIAAGDLVWMLACAASVLAGPDRFHALANIGLFYAASGALLFIARFRAASDETGVLNPKWRELRIDLVASLLGYGAMVVAAQLADYLYAPTDYILIDRLLSPADIASYAPAVQIDSGLLMLVTGLSAVLLPRAAVAHAGGSVATVRRYYLRGTLVSMGLLAIASLAVWLVAPLLLRLWLGNPMPGTQVILPLVLIGTVFGGSSAVGRSILLAVGKARAFAISVLIAGIANAVCSYIFVRYFHLGLKGILLGTVVAVVGRCVLWMPWYVTHALRAPTLALGPEPTSSGYHP